MTDYTILERPRIRQSTFERILREADSPAATEAAATWKGIVRHGVDPAFALAVFRRESNYGTRGPTVTRRNWGGLANSEKYPDDGVYAVYPSWADGARDAARLLAKYGKNTIQVGTKTDTAETFAFVFASATDRDELRRYGQAVAAAITTYIRRDREWNRALSAIGSAKTPLLDLSASSTALSGGGPYTAGFRASRIRVGPHVGAAIVHTVGAGVPIRADGVVDGGSYTTEGKRSSRWLRVVEIDGKPLPVPLFTAAVLWRKSEGDTRT